MASAATGGWPEAAVAGAAEVARTSGGGKASAAGTTAGAGFGVDDDAGDCMAANIASPACPSICLIPRLRFVPVAGGAGVDAGEGGWYSAIT